MNDGRVQLNGAALAAVLHDRQSAVAFLEVMTGFDGCVYCVRLACDGFYRYIVILTDSQSQIKGFARGFTLGGIFDNFVNFRIRLGLDFFILLPPGIACDGIRFVRTVSLDFLATVVRGVVC